MAGILMAYMDAVLREAPLPELVATELRFLSCTLLQISCLQGQALGWSLGRLIVARRQLWLSQARVPDADKAALLEAPISPRHTFGPAVEEILQRSHWEREVSQQISGGRWGWLSEGSSIAELVLRLVFAWRCSGSGWAVLLWVAMAQVVLGRAVL
ncbi:UNVERIFIED_CONTAM: hypothetical protein FKN15_034237 [Acipenser sinensis]